MEKSQMAGGDKVFDFFEQRGWAKLEGFEDTIKPDLLKDGISDEDIECAKGMAACLIGLIEDIFPRDSNIYLSFFRKRTNLSQCLGVITNEDKDGFGFYTAGICQAVKLKIEETAVHDAVMSEKTRMLAMIVGTVRMLMSRRKMIKPFEVTDYAYETDCDLRPILWSLKVISLEVCEAQEDPDVIAAELDSMAIELLVAKKLNKGGCDAAAIVELVKRNAPERVPGTEQPFMLFF
jgi:hypothetical protein